MPAADRPCIDRLAATLALEEPVGEVNQVSPAREKILARLGVHTVRDLLGFYPFRYIDLTQVADIAGAPVRPGCHDLVRDLRDEAQAPALQPAHRGDDAG